MPSSRRFSGGPGMITWASRFGSAASSQSKPPTGPIRIMPSPNEILAELKKVKYPGFTRDIVSFGVIKDIEVASPGVTVSLTAISAKQEVIDKIVADVKATVAAMRDVPAVKVKGGTAAQNPPPA